MASDAKRSFAPCPAKRTVEFSLILPPHRTSDATHEQLWAGLEYFLQEVTPLAEEAGVERGLHPDDPPRESVRGIPPIVRSVEAYDRVLGSTSMIRSTMA